MGKTHASNRKPAIEQIRRLQAELRTMVDRRATLRSKITEADIQDADMVRLIEMWTRQVGLLTEHITEIEARIKELINENTDIKNRYRIMRRTTVLALLSQRVIHQAALSMKTHYPHYLKYYQEKRAEKKSICGSSIIL